MPESEVSIATIKKNIQGSIEALQAASKLADQVNDTTERANMLEASKEILNVSVMVKNYAAEFVATHPMQADAPAPITLGPAALE